nr:hypothetical protein KK1_011842 [Ipomoea batatas]
MLKPSASEMSMKSRKFKKPMADSARVLGGVPHPVHCSTPPQSPVSHEPLPLESNLQFVRPHMRAIFVPAGTLIFQAEENALASATADDRDSVAKPAAADNDPGSDLPDLTSS